MSCKSFFISYYLGTCFNKIHIAKGLSSLFEFAMASVSRTVVVLGALLIICVVRADSKRPSDDEVQVYK